MLLLLHHFDLKIKAHPPYQIRNGGGTRTCGSGDGAARRPTRARADDAGEGGKNARLARAARRADGVAAAAAEARRVAADAARRSAMAGLVWLVKVGAARRPLERGGAAGRGCLLRDKWLVPPRRLAWVSRGFGVGARCVLCSCPRRLLGPVRRGLLGLVR